MHVRFLALDRQTARLRDELDTAVARVLESGRFVLGEELEGFEAEFAKFCGTRFAVGVASGTDALTIALQAVGVEPGDEVVTVANTCVPTIVGIEQAGARPVLVDVDPSTYTLDPDRLEEALSARTKAVVPVHLYGQCADMDGILRLAGEAGVQVVEDCAQAHGSAYRGRLAGALGRAAAFSFYPTKNLGAAGDAGAVTTDDPGVAEQARLLRNYGERERFHHVRRGRNSRLDPLQAAVLRTKLPHVERWNERRREVAAVYTAALAGTAVRPPTEATERVHSYHLYVVRAPERERFRTALLERGVDTDVHYPLPVHRQPAYGDLAPAGRSLTVSEELSGSIVSLPLHAELTDEEVAHVAQSAALSAG
ncbi:MAG: DegT/DnrJ/EryC1/StrS family aminotransferase [Actinobacteria bacterium]|nr:DegT/DnrJ/EryC1/StrS family aminotransferase [Actinomycetota bacterium]